jgi:polyvinyl alcohol dehydrogenase (cytochrome)
MAPILTRLEDDSGVLVAGQKAGMVFGFDPDQGGKPLWATRVGSGGMLGGIHWGMATDGRLAYAANADREGARIMAQGPARPGIHALDLATGEPVWSAPTPDVCGERRGCWVANSAAPTVIDGVVFAGGLDGHLRAYSTEDGSVIWDFDTAREFETVNGVPARGGSIDGPGPVVARGMVFVHSGYGTFNQMPGNVLLAFAVAGEK